MQHFVVTVKERQKFHQKTHTKNHRKRERINLHKIIKKERKASQESVHFSTCWLLFMLPAPERKSIYSIKVFGVHSAHVPTEKKKKEERF